MNSSFRRKGCPQALLRQLAFIMCLAAPFAPGAAMAADAPETGVVERGHELFARHCVICHGADGRGDTPAGRLLRPPPRDLADQIDAARRSYDEMYDAIKHGRPGSAMSAWSPMLSETQIGDLIDFVRTLSGREKVGPISADRVSLESGRRIFERECASCHGPEGAAKTNIASYLRVPPADFTDPLRMARLDDGRMFLAIYRGRPGTAMGGQGQLLSRAEVIDVMRYVRTLARPLPPGTTPAQLDLMVGDRIYRQNCLVCHGEHGDGQTPLGAELLQRPFDLTTVGPAPAHGNEDPLESIILHGRPGTAMGPWDGVLTKNDVRRVLLYVRQTFSAH